MTGWTSDVCNTNGIDIHYLRTGGAKPSVVLLHGLMGSGACWTPMARALAPEFDVVMPDARGHGESSGPDHGYSYDDHARDVESLIRALALTHPVLLGHSMGGMTAAVVASRSMVDIAGVILVDPTFLEPDRQCEVYHSNVAEVHRAALGIPKPELIAAARARHPGRSAELLELQAEARLKTRMGAFEVLAPPNPPYRDVVGAIGVPALLVIGDTEPVVTREMAAELQRLNGMVHIEQVENAGHALPFQQPERLGDIVLSFLRALTAPS